MHHISTQWNSILVFFQRTRSKIFRSKAYFEKNPKSQNPIQLKKKGRKLRKKNLKHPKKNIFKFKVNGRKKKKKRTSV